jgi:HEAT repeat protein
LRDRRAVPALVQAMKMGDETLKAAAIWALSQIRDPAALSELMAEAERPNPVLQSYLAHVLGTYQDPQVVPTLAKLLRSHHGEVSFQAAYALGECGAPVAVKALQHALSRRDHAVRTAAAASLRRLGASVRRPFWVTGWARGALALVALSGLALAVWRFYK